MTECKYTHQGSSSPSTSEDPLGLLVVASIAPALGSLWSEPKTSLPFWILNTVLQVTVSQRVSFPSQALSGFHYIPALVCLACWNPSSSSAKTWGGGSGWCSSSISPQASPSTFSPFGHLHSSSSKTLSLEWRALSFFMCRTQHSLWHTVNALSMFTEWVNKFISG